MSFADRPCAFLALASLLLASSACGKSSSAAKDSDTPGNCLPPYDDGGLSSYESAASGTVQGSGVNVSFCGIGMYLQQTGPTTTGAPSQLVLDSSSAATSSTASLPAGAVAGTVSGSIQIGSPAPGVYKSSDSSACGSLSFSYSVPTVPDAGCAAADAESGCPTGCTYTSSCPSEFGCCVPLGNTFVFQAISASSSCGTTGGPLGSWTATVTSAVASAPIDGQPTLYTPHGTLDATLVGTTGATEPVTLTLTF
jgi:hypothetical protein